jgi:predicted nucleic acid-binding protein
LKYLLDNDVFLASIYAGHEHHRAARKWLDARKAAGWGIAAESYLAAARLLMNPALMGSGAHSAETALLAIQTELEGPHPGRIVLAPRLPDPSMLRSATGHRQIMDIWLVQIARDVGAKLATRDAGALANWPGDTIAVR